MAIYKSYFVYTILITVVMRFR